METGEPIYIGDGLYVKYDGYHLEIYSWDGVKMNHRIFLDFSVRQALRKLIDRIDVRDQHGET